MKSERKKSIPPVGSGCAGNISWPQIDHAAAAAMMPENAKKAFCKKNEHENRFA
jgi:hypothetical protein